MRKLSLTGWWAGVHPASDSQTLTLQPLGTVYLAVLTVHEHRHQITEVKGACLSAIETDSHAEWLHANHVLGRSPRYSLETSAEGKIGWGERSLCCDLVTPQVSGCPREALPLEGLSASCQGKARGLGLGVPISASCGPYCAGDASPLKAAGAECSHGPSRASGCDGRALKRSVSWHHGLRVGVKCDSSCPFIPADRSNSPGMLVVTCKVTQQVSSRPAPLETVLSPQPCWVGAPIWF